MVLKIWWFYYPGSGSTFTKVGGSAYDKYGSTSIFKKILAHERLNLAILIPKYNFFFALYIIYIFVNLVQINFYSSEINFMKWK